MPEGGFNPKLASKFCPEESQAESMKTIPHGPAIPSSHFTKQIHKSPIWPEVLKNKTEIKVRCPAAVKRPYPT